MRSIRPEVLQRLEFFKDFRSVNNFQQAATATPPIPIGASAPAARTAHRPEGAGGMTLGNSYQDGQTPSPGVRSAGDTPGTERPARNGSRGWPGRQPCDETCYGYAPSHGMPQQEEGGGNRPTPPTHWKERQAVYKRRPRAGAKTKRAAPRGPGTPRAAPPTPERRMGAPSEYQPNAAPIHINN